VLIYSNLSANLTYLSACSIRERRKHCLKLIESLGLFGTYGREDALVLDARSMSIVCE
jgi:hypothetical protein